jgi:hypothetical protein
VVPQLEAASVEVGGARDRRALARDVHDAVPDAVALQLAGQAQADRTGASDEHGNVHASSLLASGTNRTAYER